MYLYRPANQPSSGVWKQPVATGYGSCRGQLTCKPQRQKCFSRPAIQTLVDSVWKQSGIKWWYYYAIPRNEIVRAWSCVCVFSRETEFAAGLEAWWQELVWLRQGGLLLCACDGELILRGCDRDLILFLWCGSNSCVDDDVHVDVRQPPVLHVPLWAVFLGESFYFKTDCTFDFQHVYMWCGGFKHGPWVYMYKVLQSNLSV